MRPSRSLRKRGMGPLFAGLGLVVGLVGIAACNDDGTGTPAQTDDQGQSGDTSQNDASQDDASQDDTSQDDTAEDSGGDFTLPPCFEACLEANPEGRDLLLGWLGCVDTTCGGIDLDTQEGVDCFFGAFAPENPEAACRTQTDACFTGPVMGCAQLMDLAEETCEPEELPMGEDALFNAAFCLLLEGWKADPETQALAWPLYTCTFPFFTGGAGCIEECAAGGEACRACAADLCAAEYSACLAHSSAPPTETTPTGAKLACQTGFECFLNCPDE